MPCPSDPDDPPDVPADVAARIAVIRAEKDGRRWAGLADRGDGPAEADPGVRRARDWSPGCRRMPNGRWVYKSITED